MTEARGTQTDPPAGARGEAGLVLKNKCFLQQSTIPIKRKQTGAGRGAQRGVGRRRRTRELRLRNRSSIDGLHQSCAESAPLDRGAGCGGVCDSDCGPLAGRLRDRLAMVGRDRAAGYVDRDAGLRHGSGAGGDGDSVRGVFHGARTRVEVGGHESRGA